MLSVDYNPTKRLVLQPIHNKKGMKKIIHLGILTNSRNTPSQVKSASQTQERRISELIFICPGFDEPSI